MFACPGVWCLRLPSPAREAAEPEPACGGRLGGHLVVQRGGAEREVIAVVGEEEVRGPRLKDLNEIDYDYSIIYIYV